MYPDLPVWELNAELPIGGVSPEYIQAEVGVIRGTADCGIGMQARALPRDCPVPRAPSTATIDSMLGTTPDAITTSEFLRGSTAAISELVTGRTSDGGGYQYRLSAWQYPNDEVARSSQVPDLVRTCTGAVSQHLVATDAVVLYDGEEPYLLAFVDGSTSYLIESIRNEAPDGSVTRIADTPTGLLPADAIDVIGDWWLQYGARPIVSSSAVSASA